jgi:hypothetical protein
MWVDGLAHHVWRYGDGVTVTDRGSHRRNHRGPGIPHTRTGKKLEVPITGILACRSDVSLNSQSVDNPDLIGWYRERGAQHLW